MNDRERPFSKTLDDDLAAFFEFVPGKTTPLPEDAARDYGSPPFIFKPVHQNGSRIRLRLLRPDGSYARWGGGDHLDRSAYTSDVRHGIVRGGGSWRLIEA